MTESDTSSSGIHDLPAPDTEMRAIESALSQLIREEISRLGGYIPFSRFMDMALYTPGLGYYSGGLRKFGAQGDFVTAPETSSLFSRCIARQCQQVLAAVPHADILEVGAGSGILAADCLAELAHCGQLPDQYLILEVSASLQAQQRETLAEKVPDLLSRVHWVDQLPQGDFRGVILANELLDAMPVERFTIYNNKTWQVGVGWQQNHFTWQRHDDPSLASKVAAIESALDHDLQEGYTSEIPLAASGWIQTVAELLSEGAILLIDYGHTRREYYHPERDQGTIMCHYRHRVHADPLILVGLQDITAHVDFTAIAEAGHAAGLHVNGFTTQAHFLLSLGIESMLSDYAPDPTLQLRLAQQVKKLVMPGEMGERFKVIALTRGFDTPLQGFLLQDHRHKL